MKKSLRHTNAWLQEAVQREAALLRTAATSSAIEGIVKPFATTKKSKAVAPRARGVHPIARVKQLSSGK
jgi:hypothetical protein